MFSNFPSGLPGVGLLALRVALATFLAIEGMTHTLAIEAAGTNVRAIAYGVALVVLSIPVGLGFLSSIVHTTVAVIGLATIGNAFQFLGLNSSGDGNWQVPTLEVVIAVALALIGPGAYSVDYRLFGPRKIAMPPRHS